MGASITILEHCLARCGGELNGKEGPTRKISDDVLAGTEEHLRGDRRAEHYRAIEEASEKKAAGDGMEFKKAGRDFEYFRHVVTPTTAITRMKMKI